MQEQNNQYSGNRQISLRNLLDIFQWQKIQDNFANITEVCVRTLDADGSALIPPSREPRLCRELIKNPAFKEKACGLCLPTFLGGSATLDKNLSFNCEAGVCKFLVPLKIEEYLAGYLLLGPVVLVMGKPKEEYAKIAEEAGLNLEEFWGALLEIKTVSFQAMRSLVELIRDIGEYTLKLSYETKTSRREEMMAPGSPKISRLLNALLDVAFQITGADIGSIMLVDKNSDELTVHSSKGLADEIASMARVKIGDGISGTAAKDGTSFLIDEDVRDNRIRRYLQRPYLASSMVVPIKVEDDVWGVMNLGVLRTSSVRFNTDNVQLIKRLVELSTIALHD